MKKNNVTNNIFNGEVIVSFDPNKTWTINVKEKIIFCKRTIENEIKNLKKMKKLLLKKEININNKKYEIVVPEISSWDIENNILYMQYCEGKNLEFYLRNEKTHKEGVEYLNALLNFFIENRIYWIDFAPRNILIGKGKIYLVDFEKGIAPKNIKIYNYLRNHVYEEYCLFLFEDERIFNLDFVFKIRDTEKNDFYYLKDIKSYRIKAIARHLGYHNTLTNEEYLNIWKMLILVEEPKLINNNIYFGGVDLDKIFINKDYFLALDEYSLKIIEMYERLYK
ncbi:MAG: hypothetical protein E7161_00680 [Firmicutes bacterium]|nr:hypothetical protein [Bacillota bacterium]